MKKPIDYLPHFKQVLPVPSPDGMIPLGVVGVTVRVQTFDSYQTRLDTALEAMKGVIPEGTNLLSSVEVESECVFQTQDIEENSPTYSYSEFTMTADAWKIPEDIYQGLRKAAGYTDEE